MISNLRKVTIALEGGGGASSDGVGDGDGDGGKGEENGTSLEFYSLDNKSSSSRQYRCGAGGHY